MMKKMYDIGWRREEMGKNVFVSWTEGKAKNKADEFD